MGKRPAQCTIGSTTKDQKIISPLPPLGQKKPKLLEKKIKSIPISTAKPTKEALL